MQTILLVVGPVRYSTVLYQNSDSSARYIQGTDRKMYTISNRIFASLACETAPTPPQQCGYATLSNFESCRCMNSSSSFASETKQNIQLLLPIDHQSKKFVLELRNGLEVASIASYILEFLLVKSALHFRKKAFHSPRSIHHRIIQNIKALKNNVSKFLERQAVQFDAFGYNRNVCLWLFGGRPVVGAGPARCIMVSPK